MGLVEIKAGRDGGRNFAPFRVSMISNPSTQTPIRFPTNPSNYISHNALKDQD